MQGDLPALLRNEHTVRLGVAGGGEKAPLGAYMAFSVWFIQTSERPWTKLPGLQRFLQPEGECWGVLALPLFCGWGETGEGEDKHVQRASYG